MSKYERDYCDCCGKLLYHSIHSNVIRYKRAGVSERIWWWQGDTGYSSADICDDCIDTIGEVVAYQKVKVDKLKEDGINKSPNKQMRNSPEPLTKTLVRRILRKARKK